MSKQVIYSTEKVEGGAGRVVKNPLHFVSPVEGATKVYLNGSHPKIAKAYEAAGVPVADISEMRALPGKTKVKDTTDPAKPAPSPDQGSSNSH